jgi:3-hydroxyethyl bacteriochlorophyllide a dehydrogenase
MHARAVVFEEPKHLKVREVALADPGADDVVIDVRWSGISTGTEKLLWTGDMPPFPGFGYPLVPGYETVGEIVEAGPDSGLKPGDMVFVPGSTAYTDARGLFGGASERLVSAASRVTPIDPALGRSGVLLALAATAHRAVRAPEALPDLIVGHGILGRLIARIVIALDGAPPTVWDNVAERRAGDFAYPVCDAADDERRDYAAVVDVSGDVAMIDTLVQRLRPQGDVVLAGFYKDRPSFDFAPAFMREARFCISAEWRPDDLTAVCGLVDAGRLSLDGLITHHTRAEEAEAAYATAFGDPSCLKMTLDWRH